MIWRVLLFANNGDPNHLGFHLNGSRNRLGYDSFVCYSKIWSVLSCDRKTSQESWANIDLEIVYAVALVVLGTWY